MEDLRGWVLWVWELVWVRELVWVWVWVWALVRVRVRVRAGMYPVCYSGLFFLLICVQLLQAVHVCMYAALEASVQLQCGRALDAHM